MNIQQFASPPVRRTFRRTARSKNICTGPITPPLDSILSTPLEGDEFTPIQIAELARYIQRTLPILPGDDLNLFLSTLFEDQSIVSVYMRAREVQETQSSRICLPFDLAWQAGARAHGSALLLQHEKPLAWVGAFAYSCGLFLSTDPVQQKTSEIHAMDPRQVRETRYLVLAEAFHVLRNRNNAVGETLGAAMGILNPYDCDPDQVARIGTAVRLANLRIESLWGIHHV
jgi:hypothetical protein